MIKTLIREGSIEIGLPAKEIESIPEYADALADGAEALVLEKKIGAVYLIRLLRALVGDLPSLQINDNL